jgi:TP901 family phage tail tape measure protein
MAGTGGHGGQGYTRFSQMNAELQQSIASFAQLVTGASAFGATVAAFREFEKQLTLTNAVAQGTIEQFERMEEATRNFALATATSATEAASALYFLAAAGFSVEESLSAMNGVLVLAQATLSEVSFVSDLVASNIRAFGLEAVDTSRLTNVFAAAMTNSLATMDKLAFSLRQVAPAASALGASVEETTAFLAELYNIGLRGEQAGTQLRNIFVRLSAPVGAAVDILREFGIATTDAYGEMRDLRDILRELGEADLTTPQLAAIAGIEGVAGLIALINAEMSGSLTEMQDSITGTNRAFELFAEQLDTFDGSANLAKNALNELFLTIGESGAGFLGPLALAFRDLVQDFRELDDATKTQISSWIAYTAIALSLFGIFRGLLGLIGPVVSFTWRLVAGFLALFKATGPIVSTFGKLVGWFVAAKAAIAGLLPLVGGLVTAVTLLTGASFAVVTGGLGLLAAAITGGVLYSVYRLIDGWKESGEAAEVAAARAQAAFDSVAGPEGSEFGRVSGQRIGSIQRFGEIAQNFSREDSEGFTLAVNLQGGIRRAQEELDRVQEEFNRVLDQSDETYLQMRDDYSAAVDNAARILGEIQSIGQNLTSRGELADIPFAEEFAREVLSRPGEDQSSVRRIVQANRAARLSAWQTTLDALREESADNRAAIDALMADEGFREFITGIGIAVDQRDSSIDQLNTIIDGFAQKQREGIDNALQSLVVGDIDVGPFVQANEEALRVFRDFVAEISGEGTTEQLLEIVQREGGSFGLRSVIDFIREQATEAGRDDVLNALIDVEAERVRSVVLGLRQLERRVRDNLSSFESAYSSFQASQTGTLEDIISSVTRRETQSFVSRISTDLEQQQREITAVIGDQQVFSANIQANLQTMSEDTITALQAAGVDLARIEQLQLSEGDTVGSLLTFDNFLLEIRRAVDAGASEDDLATLINDQITKVSLAIEVVITQLGLAGDDAEELRTIGALFARNLGGNFRFLFERIAQESEEAARAAARDTLRAERAIEDAFTRIASINRTISERLIELNESRGVFDVVARRRLDRQELEATLGLAIRDTIRQIEDLEREPSTEDNQRLLAALRRLLLTQRTQRDAIIAQAISEESMSRIDTSSLEQSSRDFSRQLAVQLAQAQAILLDTDEARISAAALQERSRFISQVRGFGQTLSSGMVTAFADFSDLLKNELNSDILSEIEDTQALIGVTLGELFSFAPLIEAIETMADDPDSTPEQIAEFADAQAEALVSVMNDYLDAMVEVGDIAEDVADQIRAILTAAANNIVSAVGSFGTTLRAATTRAAGRGGGGDPAQEARRLRRQFEDAFREIEGIRDGALRTQMRMMDMDLETRIQFDLMLDINEIARDYETQLVGLRRELEDINETFKGQPLELDRLREAYSTVIAQVEAARDAEIAYTQTFTQMVERRNRAIDTQVTRLRDLAAEVNSIQFSMLAGLQAGLIEYQRNLLSVVDVVAGATVNALDALAASVGQFVSQGGDFLEILRRNLLGVLGQFAQEAMRGLLQQLASSLSQSLTGVLGNALTSIIGGGAGGGAMAGFQAGMQAQLVAIQGTLTAFNTGFSTTLTTSAAQTQGTVTAFGVQFAAALQQAVAAVQAAAAMAMVGGLPIPMLDKGGRLGTNEWGIVGEYGPELVKGPATVIGREDTARMLSQPAEPVMVRPDVNVTNVIVGTEQEARAYLNSTAGERQVLNIIDRRTR